MSYKGKMEPQFYTDGKNYYKFIDKEVISCTPEQLNDPALNPEDGQMRMLQNFEKIPKVLSMFTNDSQYTYADSGSMAVDAKGTMLQYDRYTAPAKNTDGQSVKTKNVFVYYDKKNTLMGCDSVVVAPNEDAKSVLANIVKDKKAGEKFGGRYVFYRTVITKLDGTLPKGTAAFSPKTKFVEPWLGDMNELIGNRNPLTGVTVNS